MNTQIIRLLLTLTSLFLILTLSACGGGSSAPAGGAGGSTLSGTAATGLPLVGSINITGAAGGQALNVAIAVDGRYTADVNGLSAPFMVQAVPTDNTKPALFSYAASVNVTANVTPLTNVAMFIANGNTDPATLYSNWATAASTITSQVVVDAQAVVNANLQTSFQTAGLDATSYDIFGSSFTANSTGFDALLDTLTVDISSGSVNMTMSGNPAFTFDPAIDTTGINIGGGSGGSNTNYSVGGTVNIATTGLVLQNNGRDDLAVTGTSFTFPKRLNDGTTYNVTVKTQPAGQTCTINSASGTILSLDVTSVLVNCVASGGSSTYTVGGTVSGLTGSLTLTLFKNGTFHDAIQGFTGTVFAFTNPMDSGNLYSITLVQPTGQVCTPTNETGSIVNADITNVTISCVDTGGGTGTSATLSVNPPEFFDFSTGTAFSAATGTEDIIGVSNEGVNFGNEGAANIIGNRIMRIGTSGTLAGTTVPVWDGNAPWVNVSYHFTSGTGGLPVAVGEIWAIYTSEGNYAILKVTGLPGGNFGSSFTFEYLYNADGTRSF